MTSNDFNILEGMQELEGTEKWRFFQTHSLAKQHWFFRIAKKEILNAPRECLLPLIKFKPFTPNMVILLPKDLQKLHTVLWDL